MEIIHAKYSEVKEIVLEVKKLIAETCAVKISKIKLTDAFYQDYDLVELDWDFFLEKFNLKFNTELIGLKYEKYFPDLLPYKNSLGNLIFIIKSQFSKKYRDRTLGINKLGRLEVGDLILSVLCKKFVKRDTVKLLLIK